MNSLRVLWGTFRDDVTIFIFRSKFRCWLCSYDIVEEPLYFRSVGPALSGNNTADIDFDPIRYKGVVYTIQ